MGAFPARSRLALFAALAAAMALPHQAAAQSCTAANYQYNGPKMFIASIWVSNQLGAAPLSGNDVSSQVTFSPNGGANVEGGLGPVIEFEDIGQAQNNDGSHYSLSYPSNNLNLCVTIAHSTDVTTLDYVQFEVFKFGPTTNPMDPGSAPPLRTFFIFNISPTLFDAVGTTGVHGCDGTGPHIVCTNWDGFYNIQGVYGKTNGQFGFRATAHTEFNSSTAGSVKLDSVIAYPGTAINYINQYPVNVDVVNFHAIASSPTLVGRITAVAAEPYNLFYRLSKDSTVNISIIDPSLTSGSQVIRQIVPNLPRVGEGSPAGTLTNGDFWDGRDDNGDLMPAKSYIARFNAQSPDTWGIDHAYQTDRQVAVDPLQITDVSIAPLANSNTALAVLNYTLTEPATTFVDIWTPDTAFTSVDTPYNIDAPNANLAAGNSGQLIRRFIEHKTARSNQITFWDGRDTTGSPVRDNDYVYAINARLPSHDFATGNPTLIQNQKPAVGFVPVSRGLVGISQISPQTSVFGSSPAISGLPPYNFGYSLSRDAIVTFVIADNAGNVVKTLVNSEVRPGGQLTAEKWLDGIKDDGTYPSSGSYIAQLYAQDTLFADKITTTTVSFPINLARIADVSNTPLLSGASDQVTLNYTLSQPMNVVWNIYNPGTRVISTGTWPPAVGADIFIPGNPNQPSNPVFSIRGMRPGRTRLTETWDGRGVNGLFVPDGQYIFTLTAISTTTPVLVATDKIIGSITVARGQVIIPTFNVTQTVPKVDNGGQGVPVPPVKIEYTLTRQSSVTLHILDNNLPPNVVRDLVAGDVRDAGVTQDDFWDGRDDSGKFVPSGFYIAQLVVADLASNFANPTTAQTTVSVDPLRIFDVAVAPLKSGSNAQIIYQLSESMKVSIKIYKPGTTFDPTGAPSPPETVSLVKRIIGVRPAREAVTETWDGTDLALTQVPDGNYPFKIIASPDPTRIDSVSGNVLPSSLLASDVIVNELPVTRAASEDPLSDFNGNTIIYPNPSSSGAPVKFKVRMPVQAKLTVKLYTMAGDMVRSLNVNDFGSDPAYPTCGASDSYCLFTWQRDNASTKRVAPGVYFAVIREETTLGSAQVFQVVKKILLQ